MKGFVLNLDVICPQVIYKSPLVETESHSFLKLNPIWLLFVINNGVRLYNLEVIKHGSRERL